MTLRNLFKKVSLLMAVFLLLAGSTERIVGADLRDKDLDQALEDISKTMDKNIYRLLYNLVEKAEKENNNELRYLDRLYQSSQEEADLRARLATYYLAGSTRKDRLEAMEEAGILVLMPDQRYQIGDQTFLFKGYYLKEDMDRVDQVYQMVSGLTKVALDFSQNDGVKTVFEYLQDQGYLPKTSLAEIVSERGYLGLQALHLLKQAQDHHDHIEKILSYQGDFNSLVKELVAPIQAQEAKTQKKRQVVKGQQALVKEIKKDYVRHCGFWLDLPY